jgi:type II secretory pathway pseudopilin PulG
VTVVLVKTAAGLLRAGSRVFHTVSFMTRRSRRAMTLVELVVVCVIALIVASAAMVGFRVVTAKIKDSESKTALTAVAAAEDQMWRRYGAFSPAGDDLAAADGSYEFVADTTVPTGPGQISVSVAGDAVGLATVSSSGACLTVKHYQPQADRSLTDTSGRLDPPPQPCTGAFALTVVGVAW